MKTIKFKIKVENLEEIESKTQRIKQLSEELDREIKSLESVEVNISKERC